jgi:hypothetical protein
MRSEILRNMKTLIVWGSNEDVVVGVFQHQVCHVVRREEVV